MVEIKSKLSTASPSYAKIAHISRLAYSFWSLFFSFFSLLLLLAATFTHLMGIKQFICIILVTHIVFPLRVSFQLQLPPPAFLRLSKEAKPYLYSVSRQSIAAVVLLSTMLSCSSRLIFELTACKLPTSSLKSSPRHKQEVVVKKCFLNPTQNSTRTHLNTI